MLVTFYLFWDHTQQCLGVASGSAFRNASYKLRYHVVIWELNQSARQKVLTTVLILQHLLPSIYQRHFYFQVQKIFAFYIPLFGAIPWGSGLMYACLVSRMTNDVAQGNNRIRGSKPDQLYSREAPYPLYYLLIINFLQTHLPPWHMVMNHSSCLQIL